MKRAGFMLLAVLTGGLFASEIRAEGGAYFQTIGNGLAGWQLKGAAEPLEIEVVVPFWDTSVPAVKQLPVVLAGAPVRGKVVIKPDSVIARPVDFLQLLSPADIKAGDNLTPPDATLKRQGLRLLGHYFLVRPSTDGTLTVVAEGQRAFSWQLTKVPVQKGDIFVLTEIQNCL
ncbi:MAG: hypothetical protein WC661_14035 [Opitutaceae bacterium]|jgi:hypothetical protein